MEQKVLLGGYSSEVPPLPIPNREVKLTNADGTAYLGGRVGSRLFKPNPLRVRLFCVNSRTRIRLEEPALPVIFIFLPKPLLW